MNVQKIIKNIYTLYYLIALHRHLDGDPVMIKNDQNKRIHKLMKRAYKIPFYRDKFIASRTTPDDYHCAEDLVKFPTMDKAELRLWMQQEWANHPEKHNSLNVHSTSGSSGVPLKVIYTQKEQGCSDANWIRVLRDAGYHPLRGKMYSFQTSHRDPDDKSRDSFIQALGIMRRKVVSEDYCVGDGIADTINDINKYKPDMICFRRNCLVRIVSYAEKHNLPLWKPKLYCPISEMVDDITRKLLKKTLGDGLIDAYGLSEMGSFVYQYPGKDFYYIANDIAVVNIYDDNNQLSNDGRIIITSLYKKTYPIINYETMDLGKSYTKNALRYLTKIEGRLNDMVLHENGVESSALMLMRIANKTVGLSQFRFIEESFHDMLIQLAPDPNNTTMSRKEIENHFLDSVHDLYGSEFNIRVEWMDVLPPDETGKQRCFVCKVNKDQLKIQ